MFLFCINRANEVHFNVFWISLENAMILNRKSMVLWRKCRTLLFMFDHEKSQTSTNLSVIISLALEALSPSLSRHKLQINADCNKNTHNKRFFSSAQKLIYRKRFHNLRHLNGIFCVSLDYGQLIFTFVIYFN